MRRLKKALSALLSAAMLASVITVPVFAEDATVTDVSDEAIQDPVVATTHTRKIDAQRAGGGDVDMVRAMIANQPMLMSVDSDNSTTINADTSSLTSGEYKLESDVSLNNTLYIAETENVTIDLNGYTLTNPPATAAYYEAEDGEFYPVYWYYISQDDYYCYDVYKDSEGKYRFCYYEDYYIYWGYGETTEDGKTMYMNPGDLVEEWGLYDADNDEFELASSTQNAILNDGGTLTVKDSSDSKTGKIVSERNSISNFGTLTIEGGTLDSTGGTNAVYNDGSLTVKDGTLVGGSYYAINNDVDSSELHIYNGTFSTKGLIESDDVFTIYHSGGQVIIDNGTFSKSSDAGVLIYGLSGSDSITINGGTFKADPNASTDVNIEANNNVTITDGTFEGYIKLYDGENKISGGTFTRSSGNVLVGTNAKLDITGGTFTAANKIVDAVNRDNVLITGGTFNYTSSSDANYMFNCVTIGGNENIKINLGSGTVSFYRCKLVNRNMEADSMSFENCWIDGGSFTTTGDMKIYSKAFSLATSGSSNITNAPTFNCGGNLTISGIVNDTAELYCGIESGTFESKGTMDIIESYIGYGTAVPSFHSAGTMTITDTNSVAKFSSGKTVGDKIVNGSFSSNADIVVTGKPSTDTEQFAVIEGGTYSAAGELKLDGANITGGTFTSTLATTAITNNTISSGAFNFEQTGSVVGSGNAISGGTFTFTGAGTLTGNTLTGGTFTGDEITLTQNTFSGSASTRVENVASAANNAINNTNAIFTLAESVADQGAAVFSSGNGNTTPSGKTVQSSGTGSVEYKLYTSTYATVTMDYSYDSYGAGLRYIGTWDAVSADYAYVKYPRYTKSGPEYDRMHYQRQNADLKINSGDTVVLKVAAGLDSEFVGWYFDEDTTTMYPDNMETTTDENGTVWHYYKLENVTSDTTARPKFNYTGTYDTSWYDPGKGITAHSITDKKQLLYLSYRLDECEDVFRGETITFDVSGDTVDFADFTDFKPIGITSDFQGTFDGKNKTITNLSYTNDNAVKDDAFGLFGYATQSGTVIKNINFDNANVSSSTMITDVFVGVVAGDITGATIENCKVTNSTVKGRYVGGIAGHNNGGAKISGCEISNSTINGGMGDDNGAVIGYSDGMTLENTVSNNNTASAAWIGTCNYYTQNIINCTTLNVFKNTNTGEKKIAPIILEIRPEANNLEANAHVYVSWTEDMENNPAAYIDNYMEYGIGSEEPHGDAVTPVENLTYADRIAARCPFIVKASNTASQQAQYDAYTTKKVDASGNLMDKKLEIVKLNHYLAGGELKYQVATEESGNYAIRFISECHTLDWDYVGYKIWYTLDGSTPDTSADPQLNQSSRIVWHELGNTDGTTVQHDHANSFFFTRTIREIPETAWNSVTFAVQPYIVCQALDERGSDEYNPDGATTNVEKSNKTGDYYTYGEVTIVKPSEGAASLGTLPALQTSSEETTTPVE
ncbi:MAG: hypothetical protein ACI4EA_03295 [Candidatus Ornithomonoglobus sp.]